MSSLLFSKTRDTELSWIDGCLDLQSAGDKLAGKAIKGSDSSPNGDEKSFGDEKKKTPGLGTFFSKAIDSFISVFIKNKRMS